MYTWCHRHLFSKFPDFILIKIRFHWPNKYKRSKLVAATDVNLQPPSFSTCSLRPQIFLSAFNGIKSVLFNFQFSLTFLQNFNFSWLKTNSLIFPRPWRIFFPDHFLTCINHEYSMWWFYLLVSIPTLDNLLQMLLEQGWYTTDVMCTQWNNPKCSEDSWHRQQ